MTSTLEKELSNKETSYVDVCWYILILLGNQQEI